MVAGLEWIDWAILGTYLAGSTWLGARLAGKQQTIRDFFLGGRRLPWPAVCGSVIASEISGVTLVAVAAACWRPGGNFTYIQMALGTVAARVVIGYWLVPLYYRREIYSPYQYMGERLGPGVNRVSTLLFFLGGFLAQGARIFLAALVLNVVTGIDVLWAIAVVGAVSVVWTWLGGINTVIWTDVIQFVILVAGAVAALVTVFSLVPGGVGEVIADGLAAETEGSPNYKLRMVDPSFAPTAVFTVWTGLIGFLFLTLGSHGTDQLLAQRLFCCRDERAARKAIIGSGAGVLLALIMLFVGLGLYSFYQEHPLAPEDAALVADKPDRILPIFIRDEMPAGLRGLIFAAILAAAISTGTSVLSAMGQTALMTFYRPLLKREPTEGHQLLASRVLILVAGVILSGTAALCGVIYERYPDLLNLALAIAAYTYGPLLGMLLLAVLPVRRDARGLAWGVPMAITLVFALRYQDLAWARIAASGVCGLAVLAGAWWLRRELLRLVPLLGVAGVVLLVAWTTPPLKLAWPWHFPVGTIVTLALGTALGRKRVEGPEAASV